MVEAVRDHWLILTGVVVLLLTALVWWRSR